MYVLNKGKANEKKEIIVSKVSSVFIGIVAIILGIIFEGQNVAFLVGLAFAIAASTNFPILFFNYYLERVNHKWSFYRRNDWFIYSNNFSYFESNCLGEIFNFEKAIFPYKYPGLFSMTTSFLFIFLISKIDKKNVDENKFHLLVKQSYLGRK